ncbi:related to monooxygenase [Phialocephala subalpina]|uniref:Related to monooxygenase n=1 Tax=Phialocephala subalpina TaxID=576137 RepID=A0A1L7WFA5_9HELO|nr:related to monooxygenase [Phialocephala subalpina]
MARNDIERITSPHVLIVGAGITGLLIAQGLKKAGITYTIFDAETPGISRPREWTLAIHWSIPILEKLLPAELFNRLSETQCDPTHDRGAEETIELRNSETGEELKSIPTPNMKRVSRKKLRSFCAEGIDVLWGKTLDDVTCDAEGETVTAHFADGSSYQGNVLVGADGPKSKVRELLLGKEKSRNSSVGIVFNMAIVKYKDAEKAMHVRSGHPVNCLGYNPKGIFTAIAICDIPDPKKPETWVFQLACSWLGKRDTNLSNEQRLEFIKTAARGLAEPFRSANLWMPDDTTVHTDNMSYWIPVPFESHKGRITLVGDAAHPLPPHRGQGLNHCILDALNFVDAIMKLQAEQGTKEELIASYNTELIQRGAEEVRLSVKSALMVHDWALFMDSPLMKHGVTKVS